MEKKNVFLENSPYPIHRFVKTYFPSPIATQSLAGEGFPRLSVFFRVVFHNFFDITLYISHTMGIEKKGLRGILNFKLFNFGKYGFIADV